MTARSRRHRRVLVDDHRRRQLDADDDRHGRARTTTSRPPTSRAGADARRRHVPGQRRRRRRAGRRQVRHALRRLVDGRLLSEDAPTRRATWRSSTGSTLLDSGTATSSVTVTGFQVPTGSYDAKVGVVAYVGTLDTARAAALERHRGVRRGQPGQQVLQRHALVPGRGRSRTPAICRSSPAPPTA